MRRASCLWFLAATAVAALSLEGCGSTVVTRDALLRLPVPASVSVGTQHVAGLGVILVDGQGRALYMFPPDAARSVTCTGPCAGTWPPLVVAAGATPTETGLAIGQDLSTLPDPNTGARIVTYAGFPLYRYAGDVRPGTANGQALFLDGGPWYVLDPQGAPVTVDRAGDS